MRYLDVRLDLDSDSLQEYFLGPGSVEKGVCRPRGCVLDTVSTALRPISTRFEFARIYLSFLLCSLHPKYRGIPLDQFPRIVLYATHTIMPFFLNRYPQFIWGRHHHDSDDMGVFLEATVYWLETILPLTICFVELMSCPTPFKICFVYRVSRNVLRHTVSLPITRYLIAISS